MKIKKKMNIRKSLDKTLALFRVTILKENNINRQKEIEFIKLIAKTDKLMCDLLKKRYIKA